MEGAFACPAHSMVSQVAQLFHDSDGAGIKKGESALWAWTSQEDFLEEGSLSLGLQSSSSRPGSGWSVGTSGSGQELGLQECRALRSFLLIWAPQGDTVFVP